MLKKCKKFDDVLFINATGPDRFKKDKRQNKLEPKHIRDIVETYQLRKEEDRYSRRVQMNEIEDKGFNLNIARYVSTAEAEKEVDLAQTNLRLKGLEEKISKAKTEHNGFLQDLGLPKLP
ncbi:N-6 DNA methylase [Roseovarius phycicola]|uniref:site-specific DNA-methyltransferase (adenine-specific) n=1 Tax=Roseovarius phycicola TaxID=3080976 RepID=A0ABZ2HG16_9RHOB